MTSETTSSATEARPAAGVVCPRCGDGRLAPSRDTWVRCPGCGHRAASTYVAEALWLADQDARLHARLDWVSEQILAGAPGQPGTAARPQEGTGVRSPAAAQNLLLAGGALLLVIAAAVFVAVAWNLLGPAGQVGILGALVAALAVAAQRLRRRYRATAETLAAIGAAVAAIGALAAPDLGLGPGWTRAEPARWAAVAMTALALGSFAAAATNRLVAWRVAGIAAGSGAGLAATIGWASVDAPGPLAVAALALAGAGLLGAAALTGRPTARSWWARDLGIVGLVTAVLARLLGLAAYGDLDQHLAWAGTWALLAATAATGLVFRRGEDPGDPGSRLLAVASGAACGVAAGQALPLALFDPAGSAAALAVLALAGAGALLAGGLTRLPTTARAGAVAAAPTLWVVTLGLAGAADTSPSRSEVVAFLAVAAAAIAVVGTGPRLVSRPGSALRAGQAAPLLWVAAAVGTAAAWLVPNPDAEHTLEVYSLPAAGLLLAAGLGTRWVRRAGGSLVVLGPGLLAALVPAASLAYTQAGTDASPRRAVAVIAIGAVIAAAGAGWRLLAPLLVGIGAAGVAAAGQVLALADLVPRWIVLALAGAVLVACGFAYEALLRAGRHTLEAARRLR